MAQIRIKAGTRAQLDAAALANGLVAREPYFITDEARFAVGTATNAYQAAAKEGEATKRRVQAVSSASGAVTCDWGYFDEIRLTLTGDVVLTFTGANDGQGCTLKLVQDATGGRTVTLAESVRFNADITAYTPTATAGKGDRLGFIRDGVDNKYDFVSLIKGF